MATTAIEAMMDDSKGFAAKLLANLQNGSPKQSSLEREQAEKGLTYINVLSWPKCCGTQIQ
eukprot:1202155-Amphidinium_carterae.1